MTGLILIGLVPFAALGIMLGHLLTPDSIGPGMGGGISLLALLGGIWFPLGRPRLSPRAGAVHSLLLACSGEPRRPRRPAMEHQGLDRDGRVDDRAQRARRARVPT